MIRTCGVAVIVSLLFACQPARSAEPVSLTPEALFAAGILMWEYGVPEDLPEDEFDQFEWRVSHPTQDSEWVETGVSFKGIARGTKVRIFLWINELISPHTPREEPDGIRYSLTYCEGGKEQKRVGLMTIPKGFDDLFGVLPAGRLLNTDATSVLMLIQSGTRGESMATLSLVGGFEEGKEPSQGR